MRSKFKKKTGLNVTCIHRQDLSKVTIHKMKDIFELRKIEEQVTKPQVTITT